MARLQSSPAKKDDESGVVRLLGVLLVNAIETMGLGRGTVGAREAREWVCRPVDTHFYSFEDACQAYGLSPRALRRRLGLRVQVPRRRSSRGWMRAPNR